jgi:phosphate starvation-inducible PhoH-like protein
MPKKNKTNTSLGFTKKGVKDEKKEIIKSIITRDVKVVGKNESQKELIRSFKDNEITICTGKAGSGKTYLALAYALDLLRKTSNYYQKIYLIKSVTTLKGEEVGYLKGNLEEKIKPFMWSFTINMEKMHESHVVDQLLEAKVIEPLPLAFARGASLDNCIIIADEMQNISLDNSRTLLTRIGENSKMILLGDSNQIDLKNKKESSLDTLLQIFDGVEGIGTIRMSDEDKNVRNPIIDVIESKYEEYEKSKMQISNGRPKAA